jgi:hypothetical protein
MVVGSDENKTEDEELALQHQSLMKAKCWVVFCGDDGFESLFFLLFNILALHTSS